MISAGVIQGRQQPDRPTCGCALLWTVRKNPGGRGACPLPPRRLAESSWFVSTRPQAGYPAIACFCTLVRTCAAGSVWIFPKSDLNAASAAAHFAFVVG